MAGYWQSSFFFFCVFIDRDGVEVQKFAKKERPSQYPAILTEQAWSIKDLVYGFIRQSFFSRDEVGSPEWAR